MNNIVYIVGAVVIVLDILSFLGFRCGEVECGLSRPQPEIFNIERDLIEKNDTGI